MKRICAKLTVIKEIKVGGEGEDTSGNCGGGSGAYGGSCDGSVSGNSDKYRCYFSLAGDKVIDSE